MSNLARPINRTLPVRSNNSGKTRVLLLRQPIKSVRHDDEVGKAGFRLALGTLITLGVVGATWLLGHLGFRLGFAQMLGLPELLSEPGGGLTTGAYMLMTLPLRVVEAGVAEPMWMMLAFGLILAPAGWLAGARPQMRGGPRPTQLSLMGWWSASILSTIMACVFVAYVVSPFRRVWISPLPDDLIQIETWLSGWSTAAGIDGLVVVAAALWMVLAFRVTVPAWMKGLSISASIFALCVAAVAMSMSNATVVQLKGERSLIAAEATAAPEILLGYTRHHAAAMAVDTASGVSVRLFDVPAEFTSAGRTSISAALLESVPEEF